MSDNIKVVVKVRPLIPREIEEKLSYQWRVNNNTLYQLDQNGKDNGLSFTFDKVYDKDTKTSDVYNDIAKPIVEAATAGFNGTIFAYGQTSSGKTFTMTGTDDSPGIIPLAVLHLFETIRNIPGRDFLVRVSYIEIYNETLRDLLNVERNKIKIHDTLQGVKVDATEKVATSPDDVLKIMKEGEVNRQVGATYMNEESSRSHSIFQITIESREHTEGENESGSVNVSQLNLVDLAGSERSGQTGATGLRFKEGTHINKSLSVLALVIKQLSEDPHKYANYRDSKLTRILQNSLGGNAKTSIICAITPAAIDETISTLQFANRAKAIKNKPEVNAVATNATMIQSLTKKLSKLQTQLESKKNLEEDNHKLTKQIAAMQRLILNGFEQKNSNDLTGANRRKTWCAPRRTMISTLDPIEEDPPTVSKFFTPLLKYNPMVISGVNEFLPIENIPTESTSSLFTPTPRDSKIECSEKVIEIDSDDDDGSSDVQTCSPYHKCYGSSKTPPCVLRRNARQAEQKFQDIVDLTEREKIYMPEVVELMEKLERNTIVIEKLEEEINSLDIQCKEKDSELEQLKSRINKTDEEVKIVTSAKLELEARCIEFNTKLTDWEVSYETLQKRAKNREEELLSLLDEKNAYKKPIDIGKLPGAIPEKALTNFMNLSKDITLVNSDNESTITNDDEPSTQIQDFVIDMEKQISDKNQIIIDLEAKLNIQKNRIESLESSNKEFQEKMDQFIDKLTNVENDNLLCKSTIDALNTTLRNQKEHLDNANNDIKSYNSLIHELQCKLNEKEYNPNIEEIKIDDNTLETMIANEESIIANNENLRNIIYSLKIAIGLRNTEITNLKDTMQTNTDSTHDISIKDQLANKDKQIANLLDENESLRNQLSEHIRKINELKDEVNEFKNSTNLLIDIEKSKNSLEIQNVKYINEIEDLKQKIEKEQKTASQTKCLENQIEEMTFKIHSLENKIDHKNSLIESYKEKENKLEIEFCKAKNFILQLQDIMLKLTDDIQEIPEVIDSIGSVVSIVGNSLEIINSATNSLIVEKDRVLEENIKLKNTMSNNTTRYESEIEKLKVDINNENEQRKTIIDQNRQLIADLEKIRSEFDIKIKVNTELEAELNTAKVTISHLNEKESKSLLLNQFLHEKDKKIDDLSNNIMILKRELKDKQMEITNLTIKFNHDVTTTDHLLKTIINKISAFIVEFDIENKESCELVNTNDNENILLTLDKISNYVKILKSNKVDIISDLEKTLDEAKQKINIFSQQNIKLISEYTEIENKNRELLSQLNVINNDKDNLLKKLLDTQEIMQQLQEDIKLKAKEIECMETQALNWKDQFLNLQHDMKQRLQEIEENNLELEIPYSKLENKKNIDGGSDFLENLCRKSISYTILMPDKQTPRSLLTLCCEKISDCIQPNVNENKSLTTSSSDTIEFNNIETQTDIYKSDNLSSDILQEENTNLKNKLSILESENILLKKEQDDIRKEVQLLFEPANQLQKKIFNHKINLSTLTATTYAENKLLKSQVKVLNHHHNRFHNLFQRDIPAFKKELLQLMTILKGDKVITENDNASFKRYSLPDILDNSSTNSNCKNDSTLDGDLLMLDMNVTLSTATDNTIIGHDHSCLDVTQICLDNEVTCPASDLSQIVDPNILSQIEILKNDNQIMCDNIEELKEKNKILQAQIHSSSDIDINRINNQISPAKNDNNEKYSKLTYEITKVCVDCEKKSILISKQEQKLEELKLVLDELRIVKTQKEDIERKYNNLSLEIPATDSLIKKLSVLEKECNTKLNEINNLTLALNNKTEEFKQLQEENDTLSTQIMESITESDNLRKELDNLKEKNIKLIDKHAQLETMVIESKNTVNSKISCAQCSAKEELLCFLESKENIPFHPKLNRSHSDSDSSSRCNKLSTLQNELHASRVDCKKITEEVATIKTQLESSNLSMDQNMDLDESMTGSNIFTISKDFSNRGSTFNKFNIPNIEDERLFDTYSIDKMDCLNFYVEKTGTKKADYNQDVKIIDTMKMLYNYLSSKHVNEVDIIMKKMKDFEESKNQLQIQIADITARYVKTTQEFNEKENTLTHISNVFSQIRNNVNTINEEIFAITDKGQNGKFITMFKENLLSLLDTQFNISSANLFESLIECVVNRHQKDLNDVIAKYTKLQEHVQTVETELNMVNNDLVRLKIQLSDKENEYNLMKAHKERLHEISNAVTLDIIKKEQELSETIALGCRQLLDHDIMKPEDIDLSLPLNKNINVIFERVINQHTNRKDIVKENLVLEVKNSKTIIEEKNKELELLKVEKDKLKTMNNNISLELLNKEKQFLEQKASYEDLEANFKIKIEENNSNMNVIMNITKENNTLRDNLSQKELQLQSLTKDLNTIKQENSIERENMIGDFKQNLNKLEQDIESLKSLNKVVTNEKDKINLELEKSDQTIKQKNCDLDKMTYDLLVLRESVKENFSVIENLKDEAKTLLHENIELKEQLEQKCQYCSRLELNIKTHEKTAQIQSGMINRLQKQKDENSQSLVEKDKRLEELTEKCLALKIECDTLKQSIIQSKEDVDALKDIKENLERKVSELQSELESFHSGNNATDLQPVRQSRHRRQTIHDSNRIMDENNPNRDKYEEVFSSRFNSDDLFTGEYDSSNRSTPTRLSKGRDSYPSKQDQSDKDEEHPRPSSVLDTRRKRQSIHDMHRNVLQHIPSPNGHLAVKDKDEKSVDILGNGVEAITSESQLKERLASCMQELEDLKQRYKELDEECDTCAEYLREREDQCFRLKKEKTALENRVQELQEKLQGTPNKITVGNKRDFAHASVNTDEDINIFRPDWTNLHSVVVDRMSYDAEVDKNKKLTKALEESRYKNRELKATVANMQNELDNIASAKELEVTQQESNYKRELKELKHRYKEEINNLKVQLSTYKITDSEVAQLKARLSASEQELAKMQTKYKELDEECETCAQYLREKEELCLRLKKENNTLAEQVVDLKKRIQYMSPNRTQYSEIKFAHACVNTDEDWANLHSVVVDRMSYDLEVEKNKKLMRAIEEFHLKNRDLKAMVTKMQKALDNNAVKHNNSDLNLELQSAKAELQSCRKELDEMKGKYKELNKTSAKCLRDREENKCVLKVVKEAGLETKLHELREESHSAAMAARRKRQSHHDHNRDPLGAADTATCTGDDFLSYQVERDNSRSGTDEAYIKEINHLKKMVEQLKAEHKPSLERQSVSSSTHAQPVYVATGSAIVQTQQLSNVMKENQKLKKINTKLMTMIRKKKENLENNETAQQG